LALTWPTAVKRALLSLAFYSTLLSHFSKNASDDQNSAYDYVLLERDLENPGDFPRTQLKREESATSSTEKKTDERGGGVEPAADAA